MGVGKDVLDALKGVLLMNDKVERLTQAVERMEREQGNVRERLVRVETILDILRQAAAKRALPPPR